MLYLPVKRCRLILTRILAEGRYSAADGGVGVCQRV